MKEEGNMYSVVEKLNSFESLPRAQMSRRIRSYLRKNNKIKYSNEEKSYICLICKPPKIIEGDRISLHVYSRHYELYKFVVKNVELSEKNGF